MFSRPFRKTIPSAVTNLFVVYQFVLIWVQKESTNVFHTTARRSSLCDQQDRLLLRINGQLLHRQGPLDRSTPKQHY